VFQTVASFKSACLQLAKLKPPPSIFRVIVVLGLDPCDQVSVLHSVVHGLIKVVDEGGEVAVVVTAPLCCTALVAPSPVLCSIVVFTFHPCDDTGSSCALVHKCLVKVVHIPSPGAGVKGEVGDRFALETPAPIFRSIVMHADQVADSLPLRALKEQLSIKVICPFDLCSTGGDEDKDEDKSRHFQELR